MGLMETIDYHVHSNKSACAQQDLTIEVLVNEYTSRGFTRIALTDHYYRGHTDLFRESRRTINQLRDSSSLQVFLSAEIEIKDSSGELDCPELDQMKEILDHISASPHTKTLLKSVPAGEDSVAYLHKAHMAALENPDIDVLLHPWDGAEMVVEGLHDLPGFMLREFARAAASTGTIIEVSNCVNHWWMHSREFTESYHILVEALIEAGAKLVVGSDGHNLQVVPDVPHLSVSPTTADTRWAVKTIRSSGGNDRCIGFPKQQNQHPHTNLS